MRRVFIPILAVYACVAFGCSIEPVTCKDDTWACVVSETSNDVNQCVAGAYELRQKCTGATPVCDVSIQKCVAEKVKCKDSCKSGVLAICEEEEVALVTRCLDKNQVCGYDSKKEIYSCVDNVKSCDRDKEIYLVDANECACDKRNHWVGNVGSCACAEGYVEVKGDGNVLECEKKAVCNSNEIYFSKLNKCECDTSRGWIGTSGNCECQEEHCSSDPDVFDCSKCVNDCDEENKKCICSSECPDNCKADGSCLQEPPTSCPDNCVNDCDEENKKCICSSDCPDGCNDDGSCKPHVCPDICLNDCDSEGKCICSSDCPDKCNENGSCPDPNCPANCVNDCDKENNKCICSSKCPDECKEDGSCEPKCPTNCVNDCDKENNKCICSSDCPNDCNDDGSCKEPSSCPTNCVNDCDKENNKCICSSDCPDSCKPDGSCDTQCEEGCKKCENGKCIDKEDANHNNMFDGEEIGPNLGKDCNKHHECNSENGKNDGLCDSFIGYKCSTKCTNNKQCKDNYVCRSDGRCAPEAFETIWKVDANKKIIKFKNSNEVCNYTIDWGDGNVNTFTDCGSTGGSHSHKYSESKEYHVKIIGDYYGWACEACDYLIEVVSFGPVVFNQPDTFKSAEHLEKVSQEDIPNATLLNLYGMFESCSEFNDDIDDWDVSLVTNMAHSFWNATKFHSKLGNWDTGNVTTMSGMFRGTEKFGPKESDSSINNWNVSKVTNMSKMFEETRVFDNPLGKWNVSNVINMRDMFKNAKMFNQPLNSWNVSKCEEIDEMFNGATQFNQNLSNWSFVDGDPYYIFGNSGMNFTYDGENFYVCEMIKGNWTQIDLDHLGITITCK